MLNSFDKANQNFCHPELAAKSVETVSKRDFMPLPGVSGSYQIDVMTIKRKDSEINSE